MRENYEERVRERRLGIDLGSNSLGWAIVDYDSDAPGDKYKLIARGDSIFEEGVKIDDKSKAETSRAAERTMYKHMRLGYWRRKIRKIALLRILIENDFCPKLTDEELKEWRQYKTYPTNREFMEWLHTAEEGEKNPYHFRNLCLSERLDMSSRVDRHKLGRAIYHLNQRRGFLSNRKESTQQADGAVLQSISDIDKAMAEQGFDYLGQYFYSLYGKEKIRSRYTDRLKHYEKELLAICEKQGLSPELTAQLRRVIITQRPLKSQKQAVGHCVFEPGRTRCPSSHPLFEQYRMYAFINNIKIKTPDDKEMRRLTAEEKAKITPLFLRKSKKNFNFEDIAKALSIGKKNYCYYKSKEEKGYRFNYHLDTSVSGCVVTAQLAEAFDATKNVDEWLDNAAETYVKGANKTKFEIMNDIWHALFFFDDEEKLKEYAIASLQMDEEHAEKFAKINLPNDYGQLSLKAIRKILPYMKEYGLIYSHAVFLASLTGITWQPDDEDVLPMMPRDEAENLVDVIESYYQQEKSSITLAEYFKIYVKNAYELSDEELKKLNNSRYHPSMIEVYPEVKKPSANGNFQLGSPRINSVRNPMAMHSLHRLRHVVNALLAKGLIDRDTVIHIEMTRELNDSNRRAGIRRWQKNNENNIATYAAEIKKFKGQDYEPSDDEILKYRLWEEQDHICLYTGKKIGIEDLFDGNKFDIEHTVPRSRGGDSTVANLTLCDSKYNRETKQSQLPSELANHSDILTRIEKWESKLADFDKQLRGMSTRGMTDINAKNARIQKRHMLSLERDYWREKIDRFKMTEVPNGFARRQGVDAGVVSRYGRMYLKSLFRKVRAVKGATTAEFRKIWGIQAEYEKKARVNHSHHTIDAITIACIGEGEQNKIAAYYHDEERKRWGLDDKRAYFEKPWKTFTEDMKNLQETLIVSHYTRDNVGKATRKRIKGTKKYAQGDTARGRLHQETIYGAISQDDQIRYVIRRELAMMKDSDVKNVVDPTVRQKIMDAIAQHGSLVKAVEAGIWMNEEKGVRINKVRCYATTITRPIALRKLRDESKHEYKRSQYVANDSNYVMGIYVTTDSKGKEKREFKLVNMLDATRDSRKSKNGRIEALLPTTSAKGYPLRWRLKIGTMVLLYENSPEEVWNADKAELVRRLYKIKGMSSQIITNIPYGNIEMRHSQEARPAGDVKSQSGAYKAGEIFRPAIFMRHTQFKALVEGVDFRMDETGEINWIKR